MKPSLLTTANEKVKRFLLEPASPEPLGVLRIGLALVLLAQVYLLRGSVLEFFSHQGFVQGDLSQLLSIPNTPKISWLSSLLAPWVSEEVCVYGVCVSYICALLFFALGLFTRVASLVVWFLHWTLMNTSCTSIYGVDLYAHVFLFYLMWMPCGNALSLDVFWGRASSTPTWNARLGLRILQIHLCISYLSSGLDKAQGIQWWNGELMWRALSLPIYQQFDMRWLADFPWIGKLLGWSTLVAEIGYCVFIWPQATRLFWVIGMVGLHLGIIVFMGLGLFGTIMCVLTVAVFGISPESSWAPAGARRLRTLGRAAVTA